MIFLLLLLVLFYFYIDCDFVTFFYHLYRLRFLKDGYYNQTLWIVGASSGLGESLCYESVRSLAKCIIISARRVNELERVKQQCKKIDPKCKIIIKPLDLLEFAENEESASNYIETEILNDSSIEDINILIVNSGVTSRNIALKTELSVAKRLFNVNVLGPFALIKAFSNNVELLSSRVLKKHKKSTRRGSVSQVISLNKIINNNERSIFVTSSFGGKIGAPGQAVYSMSKHAINGLLEGIRVELYEKKIHIGIICPGKFELSENSLGGIGNNINENSGRKTNSDKKSFTKMSLKRLSELYTTAILCKLSECWIGNNPDLLFLYIKQYLPAFIPFAMKYIGPRILKKAVKQVGNGGNNNGNNKTGGNDDAVTPTPRGYDEERKKDD